MIDLKSSKKEKKKQTPQTITESQPDYPWGTTLRFEDDLVKKVGLSKAAIGDKVHIEGIGKIINLSSYESEGNPEARSVEIQLQKVEVLSPSDANQKARKEIAKEVFD